MWAMSGPVESSTQVVVIMVEGAARIGLEKAQKDMDWGSKKGYHGC